MKKSLALLFGLIFLLACPGKKPAPVRPASDTLAAKPAEKFEGGFLKDTLVASNLPENLFITIKVKDYGTMKVQFYTKDAPKNVTNVANLAIRGFYNGLTFHRIVPGFVVQGGDPKGDGTGGPGYTVEAEIRRNHEKGSMAMARLPDQVNPEHRSSGSQFYLCLRPLPQLDNQYTVIGKLVEGMDVLERLGQVPTGPGDRPLTPVVIEQVTVSTQ
ncbi:MAG: peptidylprolyl isomerase [candidate division WOR-3 bacterium]